MNPRWQLGRLARREENLASLRGHQLEPWQRDVDRTSAVTWCLACGLALTVDSAPSLGDPRVGGSVAATSCPGVRGTAPTWAIQIPTQMEATA